ncbi:hypothetical protein ACFCYN_05635 [Gottfriedia sp. NPDC056225]|uniref:hypothetical protein n=1 Tax=Gottfriedia sp. NPDC056225 TaxID=3345751 RepID=UPI0035DD0652
MKKRILIISFIVALCLGGGYWFYVYAWDSSAKVIAKEDELTRTSFLKDKRAVIYFSTTADQDINGDGLSYAVFVDENGQAKSVKMKGLELGSVTKSPNQVFLEDKNHIQILGDEYKDFQMKKSQYTGERSGYIKGKDLFFSIYNSGFSKKDGYNSDVRFGNKNGFQTGTIPSYIVASGQVGENIYILTNDPKNPKEFNLQEVVLNNKVGIKQLSKFETKDEVNPDSQVLADQYFYYIIASNASIDEHNKDEILLRIDKKTLRLDTLPLVHYSNIEDVRSTIVYNIKQSAYLLNGELFYIDGLGDVYTFNTKTEQVQKKFSLIDADKTVLYYNEQVYFRGNYVYYFRDNPKNNKFSIEVYNLKTGKLETHQEIKGINEIMTQVTKKGKSIYAYSFMMLKG